MLQSDVLIKVSHETQPIIKLSAYRVRLIRILLICLQRYIVYYFVKGTYTIYFSISFHIINKKTMIPRSDIHHDNVNKEILFVISLCVP